MTRPGHDATRRFDDALAARVIARRIAEAAHKAGRPLKFMEVCGTHTMAIARNGLREFLPPSVKLVSGPGCPVCVTPGAVIDAAIEAAARGAVIATFGDMLRVPGNRSSLEQARAAGADVRVVYSPLDALDLASGDVAAQIVFIGIGFETTAPGVAVALKKAREASAHNFSVLCAHKTVPAAMAALMSDPSTAIDGFICPGHVSVVIGPEAYAGLAAGGAPCVVTGFEPLDILQGLLMLAEQAASGRHEVEIQYFRAVKHGGNPAARAAIAEVFEESDSRWRGLGTIPGSGLNLRREFSTFDAALRFGLDLDRPDEETGCSCGEVLKGVLEPAECPLFAKECTPARPVGPCMVSSEGSCAAAYKYSGRGN